MASSTAHLQNQDTGPCLAKELGAQFSLINSPNKSLASLGGCSVALPGQGSYSEFCPLLSTASDYPHCRTVKELNDILMNPDLFTLCSTTLSLHLLLRDAGYN